jgi:hypothetical protein
MVLFLMSMSWGGVLYSQKQIVTQTHAWAMYFGNHRLSDHWGIHTEYQWRRHDLFKEWQQSLMRIGVDYYTASDLQLTLGYGWIRSYAYGAQPILHDYNEHRIWQQFVVKSRTGRFDFNHRYRIEQRFLEQWKVLPTDGMEQDGFAFRNRARYRFLITIALNRKELKDNALFLAMYDEPFLQFGKGIGKNILDQNRLYAALGYRFNKDVNLQLGYMNQYIVKPDGIQAERNHTLQVGLTYNLDFRKLE